MHAKQWSNDCHSEWRRSTRSSRRCCWRRRIARAFDEGSSYVKKYHIATRIPKHSPSETIKSKAAMYKNLMIFFAYLNTILSNHIRDSIQYMHRNAYIYSSLAPKPMVKILRQYQVYTVSSCRTFIYQILITIAYQAWR